MKYIGFWEYEPENIYKIFELGAKLEEEYGKDLPSWEKNYGKFLGAYWLGMEPKGFGLFDFDSRARYYRVCRLMRARTWI